MIREEINQVNATGLNCYRYVFISRSGAAAEPDPQITVIELKELYE